MSRMRNYKELDAWRQAMTLVETTYRLTTLLPNSERFGLVTQMQRSAISIPSNIAEGQARGTTRFGLWYIRVALGSIAELDTQVELARRLKFVNEDATSQLRTQLDRVRQMLYGMKREHERRLTTAIGTLCSVILLLTLCTRFM